MLILLNKKTINFGTTEKLIGLIGSAIAIIQLFVYQQDIKTIIFLILLFVVLYLILKIVEYISNYQRVVQSNSDITKNNKALEEQHLKNRKKIIELQQQIVILDYQNIQLKQFVKSICFSSNPQKNYAEFLTGGEQVATTMENSKDC